VTFTPAALGLRQANLSFSDNAANTTDQTVALRGTGTDASAPGVTGTPVQAVISGAVVTLTNIPVSVSWTASAGVVDHYELQRSVNNGAFTNVAIPTPTSLSAIVGVAPGTTNVFRVRACSAAGNCSAYATSTTRAIAAVQESVKDISFSGTWTNQVLAGSFGGSVRFASTNRDKAQYKPTSKTVTGIIWVATTGPDRGRATVSIDGGPPVTIELYAAEQHTGVVVFSSAVLAPGSHQVVVQVLGTHNAASTGNRVDVDGFVTFQ
jgi:hypothetical protein